MKLLCIDIETFYDSKAGYDLRDMSVLEYARDERFKLHGLGFTSLDGTLQWRWDKKLIEIMAPEILIGHNIKFDAFILAERFGVKATEYRDTLAMARAVLGNKVQDFSLAGLARYYGLPSKGTMKTNGLRDLTPEQENELSEYCLHDVWLCREIYKRLEPDFPENQFALMDQTIKMFIYPKLVLNVPLLEETAAKEKREKEELFKSIGVEKEIFSSNPKFANLLKEKGYEVPTKLSVRTGKAIPALALGDPEFLDLCESEEPTLKQLCAARVAAKSTLMETRSEKLARIGNTGNWSFDVSFSGAVQTHRYSGGSGAGGNPQNFTRDSALRAAIQAPSGFSLVVGDFANIEMRLVAYLSGDRGLIDAIEKNEDVYCNFASAFYRRKITKKDESERRFGKTAILGLGYGMGATKFQKTVRLQTGQKISIDDARKAVNLYRALYSKVPAIWQELGRRISWMEEPSAGGGWPTDLPVKYGFELLQLPSKLCLRYPNLRQEGKEWVYDGWAKKGITEPVKLYGGKVLENICQALAGELCKEVMRKFGDKVVGQIHDEIVLLSDDPETDRAELEAAMSQSPSWLPKIKLDADVHYGSNWLAAKHG